MDFKKLVVVCVLLSIAGCSGVTRCGSFSKNPIKRTIHEVIVPICNSY